MKARNLFVIVIVLAALLLSVSVALAGKPDCEDPGTVNPGFCSDKYDVDNNGYTDAGVFVTGHYTSVYAEDANGDYYWDLGDGRIYGTVGSVDELDAETVEICDYVVNYRVDFNNDPYSDAGWIQNHINCYGYGHDGVVHYDYLIVHETDPRYTGNPDWSIWGTWEYHVLVDGRNGNLVRPEHGVSE